MIRKAHNAMTSSLCTVGHFRPYVYLIDLVFAQTDNKIVAIVYIKPLQKQQYCGEWYTAKNIVLYVNLQSVSG